MNYLIIIIISIVTSLICWKLDSNLLDSFLTSNITLILLALLAINLTNINLLYINLKDIEIKIGLKQAFKETKKALSGSLIEQFILVLASIFFLILYNSHLISSYIGKDLYFIIFHFIFILLFLASFYISYDIVKAIDKLLNYDN